jgi:hypothetical protein
MKICGLIFFYLFFCFPNYLHASVTCKDSIKLKVECFDSIKQERIHVFMIKVQFKDKDSTYKLWQTVYREIEFYSNKGSINVNLKRGNKYLFRIESEGYMSTKLIEIPEIYDKRKFKIKYNMKQMPIGH